MIQVGDVVQIGEGGQNRFTVVEVDDEGRAMLEAVSDAPGRYQFSMPLSALRSAS
ncbi:hypothetical protein ACPESR_25125 [Nocardia testacea]|uniref:hypothetical protein n=1 Tax=Nocardia testacea TaxID=248551 RepID=UPI003C2BECE9